MTFKPSKECLKCYPMYKDQIPTTKRKSKRKSKKKIRRFSKKMKY